MLFWIILAGVMIILILFAFEAIMEFLSWVFTVMFYAAIAGVIMFIIGLFVGLSF